MTRSSLLLALLCSLCSVKTYAQNLSGYTGAYFCNDTRQTLRLGLDRLPGKLELVGDPHHPTATFTIVEAKPLGGAESDDEQRVELSLQGPYGNYTAVGTRNHAGTEFRLEFENAVGSTIPATTQFVRMDHDVHQMHWLCTALNGTLALEDSSLAVVVSMATGRLQMWLWVNPRFNRGKPYRMGTHPAWICKLDTTHMHFYAAFPELKWTFRAEPRFGPDGKLAELDFYRLRQYADNPMADQMTDFMVVNGERVHYDFRKISPEAVVKGNTSLQVLYGPVSETSSEEDPFGFGDN